MKAEWFEAEKGWRCTECGATLPEAPEGAEGKVLVTCKACGATWLFDLRKFPWENATRRVAPVLWVHNKEWGEFLEEVKRAAFKV